MAGPQLPIAIKHETYNLWFNEEKDTVEFKEISESDIWKPNIRFFVPTGCRCFIQTFNRQLLSLDEEGNIIVKDIHEGIKQNDMFDLEFVTPNKVRIIKVDNINNQIQFLHNNNNNLSLSKYTDQLESNNSIFEIQSLFI